MPEGNVNINATFVGIVASLSNITTDRGALSPTFSSNTRNYEIEVGGQHSNITFTFTAQFGSSIDVGNTHTMSLVEGENFLTVTVTSECGTFTETYTIKVILLETPEKSSFNIDPMLLFIIAGVIGGLGLVAMMIWRKQKRKLAKLKV